MPEKIKLTPDNYQEPLDNNLEADFINPDQDESLELPSVESALEDTPAKDQVELDSLAEQARDLAESHQSSSPETSSEAAPEKYRQAVFELMNQVGDSGMQQIELLAHGSERLNGFRAVIETGFNPSSDKIEAEIAAIRELIVAKRDLTQLDHQTHSSANALIKDQDSAKFFKQRSVDDYRADLNSLKLAINDETAIKDDQLITLLDAIPSQGEVSTITSAMEQAIEAMRSRGHGFADSSTAKLMTLLQSMAQETSR